MESMRHSWEEAAPIVAQKVESLPTIERLNPITRDMIRKELAIKQIKDLGITKIAVGMLLGAVKNLAQTGFYVTFTQMNQPTTFFSAMAGDNFHEKLLKFFYYYRLNWDLALENFFLTKKILKNKIVFTEEEKEFFFENFLNFFRIFFSFKIVICGNDFHIFWDYVAQNTNKFFN